MTEGFMRHLIAFIATLVAALFYFAGYVAGVAHWPFAALGVFFMYLIVYKLIDL